MKYHYRPVSRTTISIALIAEDKKETALILENRRPEKMTSAFCCFSNYGNGYSLIRAAPLLSPPLGAERGHSVIDQSQSQQALIFVKSLPSTKLCQIDFLN